ncbi:MepB family protein [Bacillus carboniphilus]|uniref:MepB family protein n=1 Tax=Bacillus carboniphilus TaxID=86663 RepID=A0ABY9JRQ4_9BACI|nr:MepB family protein [Bacillus carboniphilus]WLR42096.1 MepB family protein [Bacillus carboniphilus]
MNKFFSALEYVNEHIYEPNQLVIRSIQEEQQNSNYGGGTFLLSNKSIRFRVSKRTPNKIGEFVAIWEKGEDSKNTAFSYENAPDILVINTTIKENQFGQFIIPKETLAKRNILKTRSSKGKMGLRVYPSWESPTGKQALMTQKWQLPYFVDMSNMNDLPIKKILQLYLQ